MIGALQGDQVSEGGMGRDIVGFGREVWSKETT
jgi:hypothetical protein